MRDCYSCGGGGGGGGGGGDDGSSSCAGIFNIYRSRTMLFLLLLPLFISP